MTTPERGKKGTVWGKILPAGARAARTEAAETLQARAAARHGRYGEILHEDPWER